MSRLVCLCAMTCLFACGPKLGPKEQAELATHAALLATCRAKALDVGADAGLAVFDACVDGGAK